MVLVSVLHTVFCIFIQVKGLVSHFFSEGASGLCVLFTLSTPLMPHPICKQGRSAESTNKNAGKEEAKRRGRVISSSCKTYQGNTILDIPTEK